MRETGALLFDIIRKVILDFEAKHDLEVVGFTTDSYLLEYFHIALRSDGHNQIHSGRDSE